MFINNVQTLKLEIDDDVDTLEDLTRAVREHIGNVPHDKLILSIEDEELVITYESDI